MNQGAPSTASACSFERHLAETLRGPPAAEVTKWTVLDCRRVRLLTPAAAVPGFKARTNCPVRSLPARGRYFHGRKQLATSAAIGCLVMLAGLPAAPAAPATVVKLGRATLDAWSAPYRGWHYYPEPIIPSDLKIPGHENFQNFDVPTAYQIPGQPGKWFMSYIGFNGEGYNSFVSESTNLLQWTHPRLAMGFGPTNEFDHGGCVLGAFLYES